MGLNYVLAFPSAVLFHLLMFFLLSATKAEERIVFVQTFRMKLSIETPWERSHAAGVPGVTEKNIRLHSMEAQEGNCVGY